MGWPAWIWLLLLAGVILVWAGFITAVRDARREQAGEWPELDEAGPPAWDADRGLVVLADRGGWISGPCLDDPDEAWIAGLRDEDPPGNSPGPGPEPFGEEGPAPGASPADLAWLDRLREALAVNVAIDMDAQDADADDYCQQIAEDMANARLDIIGRLSKGQQ